MWKIIGDRFYYSTTKMRNCPYFHIFEKFDKSKRRHITIVRRRDDPACCDVNQGRTTARRKTICDVAVLWFYWTHVHKYFSNATAPCYAKRSTCYVQMNGVSVVVQCSSTCGPGEQVRAVVCRRVSAEMPPCLPEDRPPERRTCRARIPCYGTTGNCISTDTETHHRLCGQQ